MTPFELDVRPILRSGGEPFGAIMEAVQSLAPGQALRLLATFRPVPLFQVLARQGFANEVRQLDDGDWEVLFTPVRGQRDDALPISPTSPLTWPEPSRHLDCTLLEPAQPMVQILSILEAMTANEVLFVLLPREPLLLFPELRARGHSWYGETDAAGSSYRMFILAGSGDEA